MPMASILALSNWMPGYSAATLRAASINTPSVWRSTLALCTAVTFLRPCWAASSKDHQGDAILVVQGVARIGFAGAQAYVQIEHLPHAYNGAAIAVALALQFG